MAITSIKNQISLCTSSIHASNSTSSRSNQKNCHYRNQRQLSSRQKLNSVLPTFNRIQTIKSVAITAVENQISLGTSFIHASNSTIRRSNQKNCHCRNQRHLSSRQELNLILPPCDQIQSITSVAITSVEHKTSLGTSSIHASNSTSSRSTIRIATAETNVSFPHAKN